jgi:hypothetical protein
MFELQDLWAKAYLRQGGQWGWFLCTDPDDPWGKHCRGSSMLASTCRPASRRTRVALRSAGLAIGAA